MKRFTIVLSLVAVGVQAPYRFRRNLRPAANESLARVVPAKGVQIYECRDGKWAFVAPEAELFDRSGKKIGTHYAGPHWEAADGSRIVGTVKQRADAPAGGNIPWLLLATKSVGNDGAFSKVSSIQRVATVGGVARLAAVPKAPRRGWTTARITTSSPPNEDRATVPALLCGSRGNRDRGLRRGGAAPLRLTS
jgi:hypothetical protein